jgi:hypothetical protein
LGDNLIKPIILKGHYGANSCPHIHITTQERLLAQHRERLLYLIDTRDDSEAVFVLDGDFASEHGDLVSEHGDFASEQKRDLDE